MTVPIDVAAAQGRYAVNAPAAAEYWASRAEAQAGKWEREAKSPASETRFRQALEVVIANQLRLKGLMPVTAADYASGVRGSVDIYRTKTAAKAPKWGARFAPFAEWLNRTVPTLAAKIPGQIRTNVMNRVVPIAEGLHALKIRGVASPVAPVASPLGGGGSPTYGGGVTTPTAPTARTPFTTRY